jgi:hypothetical protein
VLAAGSGGQLFVAAGGDLGVPECGHRGRAVDRPERRADQPVGRQWRGADRTAGRLRSTGVRGPWHRAADAQHRSALRAALPKVRAGWDLRRVDEQIRGRARQLDLTHPVVPNEVVRYMPPARHGVDDLGRLRTFDWITTAAVVVGGVHRWNDFDQHRPDTVPWIARRVLTADDPEQVVLEVLTDQRGADLTRIPGPAGPIYQVGQRPAPRPRHADPGGPADRRRGVRHPGAGPGA